MNRFEAGFGSWVVKLRWWLVAASILMVFAAANGLRFITFNTDTRVFFSEQNPQLQALEALENTYTEKHNVLFVIAPKDGDVFTRETLAAIEELTEASWKMPYSSRVDSIANFQHTRSEDDDLIVEGLVEDAETLSDADLERIKKIARSEPQLVNRLISPSGHVAGVNVNCLYPGDLLAELPKNVVFARKLRDDLRQKYPDIDVYLTGGVIADNAFSEISRQDMATLVPAMFVVLIVLVGLTLRSFVGTFTTLAVILMSMVTGMGLAGWLGIAITPASVNAPLVIATLAVADCVHILATTFRQMRMGRTKHDAIAFSLGDNLRAVFLTSATTAIGFLSMNLSDVPPFRDLGNMVAMGVMAAFLYSILFLPSLLAVLPVRVEPQLEKAKSACCGGWADFVINRRTPLLWGTLAVVALLAAGTLRIEFNDNWFKYFSERYDIRTSSDFAQENLTGHNVIEYSLDSGEPAGISNPEYLANVETFANWYRMQPKALHVQPITDIMKRLNKNMHGDDEFWYRIPDQRDLAAQYLLLYEMSLPFGLDLNDQIDVEKSATRMVVTLEDTTTTELRDMDEKARAWLKANAPENMFTYGSGLSIIWAHISERNIRAMLGASFGALILSGYKMNADMGLLTAITITLALALDFLLLPVLLMKVEGQADETIVDHIRHIHAPATPSGLGQDA